jgi:uncharacterized protein (AIM24 family)
MEASVSQGVGQSLGEFVQTHTQKDTGGTWQLESKKLLEIKLSGNQVFTKVGAMVAYYGDIKFQRSGSGGASKWLKSKVTGEGVTTMDCVGTGILYVADQGKEITILQLNGETIYVDGRDCLAYSETLEWDIVMSGRAGMMAGGLFSLKLSGTGLVAITTEGPPLVLGVSPQVPLFTDGDATVAWSDGLSMTMKTDVNWKSLIGKSSGETVQMQFSGTGFVVVQPFEEAAGGSAPSGTNSGGGGGGLSLGGLLGG